MYEDKNGVILDFKHGRIKSEFKIDLTNTY